MEASIGKLIEIGWIVVSFTFGFLSFYLVGEESKQQKKEYIDQITSQLINLVLFVWLSKIVLHLPLFISDPLAILAYPSDSNVFYLGVACTVILLMIQSRRGEIEVFPLVEPFLFVFFISSFIYEFIQFAIYDNPYAFGSLLLLAILIAIYFFFKERLELLPFYTVIISIWSLGMLILTFTQPFVTVFGYMMTPWFIVLLYSASMIGLLVKRKLK